MPKFLKHTENMLDLCTALDPIYEELEKGIITYSVNILAITSTELLFPFIDKTYEVEYPLAELLCLNSKELTEYYIEKIHQELIDKFKSDFHISENDTHTVITEVEYKYKIPKKTANVVSKNVDSYCIEWLPYYITKHFSFY